MGHAAGGGAIILANTETKTLQDTGTILVSVLGGGLVSLYLLGFFTNRGDTVAVWSGLVCTLLFTVGTVLSQKELLPPTFCAPFDLYYTAIVGNLLMFIVGFGVSLAPRRGTRNLRNLTLWNMDDGKK